VTDIGQHFVNDQVRWKTNKNAPGATIFAGAGPLPPGSAGGGVAGQISPTRLAVQLIPS
jgi:hypothetical protein